MFTLVESISLAGDRAKQNDDAHGAQGSCAWVIDGATDLHETPLTGAASDAAWIATRLNARLFAEQARIQGDVDLRARVRAAAHDAGEAFAALAQPAERWKYPVASMLLAAETDAGIIGVDLGDCRAFAVDARGEAHAIGGPDRAADNESKLAARAADAAKGAPLLKHDDTLDLLRRLRARQNTPEGGWTFCVWPECADHARIWRIPLRRPAHVLLATDGFAALVDRYAVYNPAGLVAAAVEHGLQQLAVRLRAIETEDASGARHPRWKRSDDATALLLRLT